MTIESLAIREGKSERSIRMTLSLAFMSPALAEAAMEGRLPRGFCIKRLTDLPMIPMRPSPKSLTRRPINSAAEPHGRTAAGSLDQNDSVATNGPEIGARAAASAPDGTSQVSNRLAVLAELSVADLRLEWRRLYGGPLLRLERPGERRPATAGRPR